MLGADGVSDFDALRSGKHNKQAQLYAFDMLAGDGEDHRRLTLALRKSNLARYSRDPSAASSSPTTSKARSALISFAPPAIWVSKVLSRSAP